MSARRALLRLARRDARQYARRTVLMLLLIALPITGTALAATLVTTLQVTGQDRATAAMGGADLVLYADGRVDAVDVWPEAQRRLGRVESAEPVAMRTHELRHGSAAATAAVWAADESRTARAMLDLVDGSWPDGRGEVVLSPALSADLGATIGDPVLVDGARFELVGIARDRLDLDRRIGVTTLDGATPNAWFVDLPEGARLDLDTVGRLESLGVIPALRSTILAGGSSEVALGIVLVGGLAFVVVMLVASAAFAVVAEQRRLDLARLRAVGATPRQLRGAVTASGWIIGSLAAVTGILIGVGATLAARGPLERLTDRAIVGVRVPWAVLGAIAVVGVLTAVLAARAPARRAAAGAAKEALAGTAALRAWERVPIVRVVAGLVGLVGLAAFLAAAPRTSLGVGALVTLSLVFLAIVGAGGAGQVAIAAVARLLRTRARPPLRIALRDLMRMPSRVTPIVTALVAVLALNVLLVGFVTTATESRQSSGATVRLGPEHFHIDGPTPAAALPEIAQALPVTQAASLRIIQPVPLNGDVSIAAQQLPYVGLATDELLTNLGLDELRADATAGRTIVIDSPGLPAQPVPPVLAPHGVTSVTQAFWPRDVPRILVPPATVDAAGLVPAREGVRLLVRLDRPVTDDDLALAAVIAARYDQRIQGAQPPPSIDAGQVRTLATGVTTTVALLVALAGLALLTAQGRSVDQTLLEIGAPPRLHRQLAAVRALLLCGLAAGLALVIGAFALSAVTRTGSTSTLTDRVALPVPVTVAATLLIPVVAAVVAWAPWRRARAGVLVRRRA